MRNKSVLSVIIGLLVPLFLLVHPTTQAQELRSVSYEEIQRTAKNSPPDIPVKLMIPAAKISATIEHVGLKGDQMDVPKESENVAWYQDGFRPGEKGNAVIDGHLDDSTGEPAVFWKLRLLRPNDDIFITDASGMKKRFRVASIGEYSSERVPMKTLFTKSLSANLILITCAGEYDTSSKNYTNRLIVSAAMVE